MECFSYLYIKTWKDEMRKILKRREICLQLMKSSVLPESSGFLSSVSKLSILHSSLKTWVRWMSLLSPLFNLIFVFKSIHQTVFKSFEWESNHPCLNCLYFIPLMSALLADGSDIHRVQELILDLQREGAESRWVEERGGKSNAEESKIGGDING